MSKAGKFKFAFLFFLSMLVTLPALAQEAIGDCQNCYECTTMYIYNQAHCQDSSNAPLADHEDCTLKIQDADDCRTINASCLGTDNSCKGDPGGLPGGPEGIRVFLNSGGEVDGFEPDWFSPL